MINIKHGHCHLIHGSSVFFGYIHSPPKETLHLVLELPWPQFGVNDPIGARSCDPLGSLTQTGVVGAPEPSVAFLLEGSVCAKKHRRAMYQKAVTLFYLRTWSGHIRSMSYADQYRYNNIDQISWIGPKLTTINYNYLLLQFVEFEY